MKAPQSLYELYDKAVGSIWSDAEALATILRNNGGGSRNAEFLPTVAALRASLASRLHIISANCLDPSSREPAANFVRGEGIWSSYANVSSEQLRQISTKWEA